MSRRFWPPSDESVLVVGAGPAGLECARALGQRGYAVHLAEATKDLGGRVSAESRLPGLAEWARVRDHRVHQIGRMPNVEIYRDSLLTADHVREFGVPHVVVATGARWRRDGVGRDRIRPVPGFDGAAVYTPDDIMAGAMPAGPVVIFDDDHFYMGGVLAEKLRQGGIEVALVTPAEAASVWTANTLEVRHIQKRLLELGVEIVANRTVTGFDGEAVELACVFTGRRPQRPCASVVTVTARLPVEGLYRDLRGDPDALAAAGIRSVTAIGDCLAPGTIAMAVYAGHRYAREFGEPPGPTVPFKRELPIYAAGQLRG